MSASFGATPMTPKCGRIGMRTFFEDVVVLLHDRMVDRHAWIVDDLVHDTIRIGLRNPAEVIDRVRPVLLPAGVDLVDRAHLAGLRFSKQIIVMKAPPGRRVAAE